MRGFLIALLAAAACGDDRSTNPDGNPGSGDGGTDATTTCAPTPGWSTTTPLAMGPTQETAVVALGTRIYVLGGFNDTAAVVPWVQVFDTTTCTWSEGPVLPRTVHHANAAVVGDTIWVVGAMETLNFTSHGHVWSWNPATDAAWATHTDMPAGTERGASVVGVIGTKIFLAGGLRNGAVTNVSSFDTATQTWDTTLPALPVARDHGCGAAIGDVLYVAGGRAGSITSQSATLYALAPGGAWETKAPMPTGRGGTACGVINGKLIVVGGEGNSAAQSGVFPQVESYDPYLDAWTTLAPMPVPRHGMGAAVVGNSLYVPGGATRQAFGADATFEVFTP